MGAHHGIDRGRWAGHLDSGHAPPPEQVQQELARWARDAGGGLPSPYSDDLGRPRPLKFESCPVGNFVGTSTIHNACRIAARKVGTDATPHDLRHFFASGQIRGGQSIKVLQALLGHKSAVETWDTYGHLMGAEDTRSRAIVDSLIGNDRQRASVAPSENRGHSMGTVDAL